MNQKMAVLLDDSQANTQVVVCLFSHISETSQTKRQDFPRVECQYFICPIFFPEKFYQIWTVGIFSAFTTFCLQLSQFRKNIQFQNWLPLFSTASAPLRRYLIQNKATSFISRTTLQDLQAMSDFRVKITKKTKRKQSEHNIPNTQSLHLSHYTFGH